MKMMKKPSRFMKQIITVLTSKTKTLKTRLIIFSFLLRSSSFNHKLHSLMGHRQNPQNDAVEYSNAMTHESLPDSTQIESEYPEELNHLQLQNDYDKDDPMSDPTHEEFEYPDLTHFELQTDDEDQPNGAMDHENVPDPTRFVVDDPDVEMEDPVGSVIELVKSSKKLREGEEFKLEDDIDQVADLFIRRFHQQMRLQKQQSFNRYQEMLQNNF